MNWKSSEIGGNHRQGFSYESECVTEFFFSYFTTKAYVVGTQKNSLNETILLSTKNIC